MATSSKSSTRSGLTSASSSKDTSSKELLALKAEVTTLSKRLSAAEAKLAAAPAASAPSGDAVSRHEWKLLLQKLSSYIGFDLSKR